MILKALHAILFLALFLDVFFVWCCCYVAGRYDEAAGQHLDWDKNKDSF